MLVWNRRSFLKAAFGAPAPIQWLGQLAEAQPVPRQALVEMDLEATQQWLPVGGRSGYLYAFNWQVPGPIVEARPGDRIRIRFHNSLPEPTNVHYHGLHVPSTGNADNVMLRVPPGESFTYEFDLPPTHPGGTFWYHPHVHESAARQVSRGLAGVFIVRGELDQIPEIAAAEEAVLVLQDFDLSASGLPIEPNMMERMVGREGDLLTVNGRVNPAIGIKRGGWLRLRILNASSSRFYRLRLEEHPFHVIATEGGALAAPEERDEVLLTPGERLEVMVQGARPGGGFRLLSLPYNRGGMGMGMMGSTDSRELVLASLTYEGEAEETWSLPRQLVNVDPLPEPSARRTFQLGQGIGMGMMMGSRTTFTINGRTFDPSRMDTRVTLNTIEEWEFVNPSMMDHPMHIHTNPFQVVGPDGSPNRAWKDVVLVRAGSRVRIRTAFRDFAGPTTYHCHILDHEDQGMMGLLEIEA